MDLLELERIEDDLFRGQSPDTDVQRVFGGQVLGQALTAATHTVEDDRAVHSLHAYFLLPGDPAAPIVYEVDRSRTGRSFSTRRVVARQHGRNIFVMSASYQIPEPGLDHADPRPDAPDPESLSAIPPSPADDGEDALWNILYRRWTAFDIRRVPDTGPERRQV